MVEGTREGTLEAINSIEGGNTKRERERERIEGGGQGPAGPRFE